MHLPSRSLEIPGRRHISRVLPCRDTSDSSATQSIFLGICICHQAKVDRSIVGDASEMLPGPDFPHVPSSSTLQVVGDLLPIFFIFYLSSLPQGCMVDSFAYPPCRFDRDRQAVGAKVKIPSLGDPYPLMLSLQGLLVCRDLTPPEVHCRNTALNLSQPKSPNAKSVINARRINCRTEGRPFHPSFATMMGIKTWALLLLAFLSSAEAAVRQYTLELTNDVVAP